MKHKFKNYYFVIILIFLTLCCAVKVQAQFWEQVVGSSGGRVMSLGISESNVLFSGTQFGEIYRSVDNGENWESMIGTGRWGNEMRSVLTLDDSIVFVGSGQGVLRSLDYGSNWDNVTSSFFTDQVGALSLHPDGRIFALDAFFGNVMYSSDLGVTWDYTGQGANEIDCFDMAIDSSGRIFVASMGGIQRSVDDGDSWEYVGSDSGLFWALSVELDSLGTVYAGTLEYGLFRSDDNGDTWNHIINGIDEDFISIFSILTVDSATVFAGSYFGVYRSTDRGENWTEVREGLFGVEFSGLQENSIGDIFTGSFAGVSRSSDNGDTWTQKSSGFSASTVNDIAVYEAGEIYVASEFSGIMRSLDNGVSWERKSNGLESPEGSLSPIKAIGIDNDGNIYAAGHSNSFFKSEDKGDSWTAVINNSIFLLPHEIVSNDRNHLYLGTEFGIYRSLDEGNSWIRIHSTGVKDHGAIDFKFNGNIYIIDYTSDIFKSSNNGNSWEKIYDSNSNSGFLTINLSPDGYIFANTGDAFIRSFDDGNNWDILTLPAEPKTVDINSENEIFIGTGSSEIYFSSDFGDNWVEISDGLPMWSNVNSFVIDFDTYLFAGLSAGGLFRSSQPTALNALLAGQGTILDISDFTNDEGGVVTLNWSASSFEGIAGDSSVMSYDIYRWDEMSLESSESADNHEETKQIQSLTNKNNALSSSVAGSWVLVASTDALGVNDYSLPVPTLRDSSAEGINFSSYKVRSIGVDSTNFFDSKPSYGYSVDNIPPDIPLNVIASAENETINLYWSSVENTDLSHYAIYRGFSEGFDPNTLGILAETEDTSFADSAVTVEIDFYYRISAFDIHGNESQYSEEVMARIIGISRDGAEVPQNYLLSQNHPNPFNPLTNIRYSLPLSVDVSLIIYNLLGEEIARIVDGFQSAGEYQSQWNASDFASGIYFYRLQAGDFIQTRKMVLMK